MVWLRAPQPLVILGLAFLTSCGINPPLVVAPASPGIFQSPYVIAASGSSNFTFVARLSDGRWRTIQVSPSGAPTVQLIGNTPVPAPAQAPATGRASQFGATADFVGNGGKGGALIQPGGNAAQVEIANADFSLNPPVSYATGPGTTSVLAADLNGDGNPDLVVSCLGNATTAPAVWVLLNNGDGTFGTAVAYPAGPAPVSMAAADLNGDGIPDLAVVSQAVAGADASLIILIGNANGTFNAVTPIADLGTDMPVSVLATDLNGDGNADLAVAFSGGAIGVVQVFFGNGDGMFQYPASYPAGPLPTYLAAGDLNNDGRPDLVTSNSGNGTVSVLLANSDGTFQPEALPFEAAYSPNSLVLTDFNSDGNLDIVVGFGSPDCIGPDSGSGTIAVLYGYGNGTFQSPTLNPAGTAPVAVAAADLNGDGRPDVVAANPAADTLSIMLASAGGGLGSPVVLALGPGGSVNPVAVAAADFNGDGKIDLAAVGSSSGLAYVLLGNGDGTFQAPVPYAAVPGANFLVVADVNGDGHPDLLVTGQGPPGGVKGGIAVLLGNGDGSFRPAVNYAAGSHPVRLTAADFNGDGKIDLAVADFGTVGSASDPGGIDILLGKGDGTFLPAVKSAAGVNPNLVAAGDWNGDGKPDLALGRQDGNGHSFIDVWLGKGDGTFQAPVSYATAGGLADLRAADFTGTGKLSLVVAHCCGVAATGYLAGNGDGTLQAENPFPAGPATAGLAVADMNGDGRPDLVVANNTGGLGGVGVLLNQAGAATASGGLSAVNSAWPAGGTAVAPDSIASVFGARLAVGTLQAASPVANVLGTTVAIKDSAGVTRPAALYYVSPGQVKFVVPAGTASGGAAITLTAGDGTVTTGTAQIAAVAPGLFQLNSSGLAAALAVESTPGSAPQTAPVYQVGAAGSIVPLPIVLNSGGQAYLELFGTGLRHAQNISATVGGLAVPPQYAGPVASIAGEDQINLGPLPAALAGQGAVKVLLNADGQTANPVGVTFQLMKQEAGAEVTQYSIAGNPMVPVPLQIPVGSLGPGSYRCELTALDSLRHSAIRKLEFSVQ